MQVKTYVDVDIVAVEQDDEVTVMIELTAPVPAGDTPRPPAAVQVVLDRSGSMDGERLGAAKQALVRLVDRLDAPTASGSSPSTTRCASSSPPACCRTSRRRAARSPTSRRVA
jgi:hypothetical protein